MISESLCYYSDFCPDDDFYFAFNVNDSVLSKLELGGGTYRVVWPKILYTPQFVLVILSVASITDYFDN